MFVHREYEAIRRQPLTIICVVFDYLNNDYHTMFTVLHKSIKHNMPDADILLITQQPDIEVNDNHKDDSKNNYASFRAKLDIWAENVNIDDDIIFLDVDMVVDKDLSHVFDQEFDVAITTRSHKNKSINSGVVFVRNTDTAKQFIRQWAKIDSRMFWDTAFHYEWRKSYRGMNQTSLGYMVHNQGEAKLLYLPCKIYNCCDDDWRLLNDDTCIVHLKKPLREVVQRRRHIKKVAVKYKGAGKAYSIWRRYYEM